MQKANFLLAAVFFLVITACVTERKPQSLQSRDIFVEIQNPATLWTKFSDDREEIIRSNPTHFWSWARQQNWLQIKELLKYQGQIVGDPHIGNFADVHNSRGVSEFSVVDIDDGGVGPFILDFIKFASYVKFVYPEVNQYALYSNYKRGLEGESYRAIAELENALSMTYADLFKKSQKKVDKKTSKNKFKKDEMELSDLDKLPIDDQKIAGDLSEYLLKQDGVEQILDVGFRVPTKGGSKGRKRYLYLIRFNNHSEIVEFKELGNPATAFYQNQKENRERIRNLSEYYLRVPEAGFTALRFREKDFWFRKKYLQDFDDDAIDELDFAAKARHLFYIANYMGRMQRAQPMSNVYIQELKINTKIYDPIILDFIISYVEEIKKLSGLE